MKYLLSLFLLLSVSIGFSQGTQVCQDTGVPNFTPGSDDCHLYFDLTGETLYLYIGATWVPVSTLNGMFSASNNTGTWAVSDAVLQSTTNLEGENVNIGDFYGNNNGIYLRISDATNSAWLGDIDGNNSGTYIRVAGTRVIFGDPDLISSGVYYNMDLTARRISEGDPDGNITGFYRRLDVPGANYTVGDIAGGSNGTTFSISDADQTVRFGDLDVIGNGTYLEMDNTTSSTTITNTVILEDIATQTGTQVGLVGYDATGKLIPASAGVSGAINGLSLDGSDVILGGTLDRTTTITTSGFQYQLSNVDVGDSEAAQFTIDADGDRMQMFYGTFAGTPSNYLVVSDTGSYVYSTDSGNATWSEVRADLDSLTLETATSSVVEGQVHLTPTRVFINHPTQVDIYSADDVQIGSAAATFIEVDNGTALVTITDAVRLPDIASQTGTAVGLVAYDGAGDLIPYELAVSNGLLRDGQDTIELGGSLNRNTTIDLNGNDMYFNDVTSGVVSEAAFEPSLFYWNIQDLTAQSNQLLVSAGIISATALDNSTNDSGSLTVDSDDIVMSLDEAGSEVGHFDIRFDSLLISHVSSVRIKTPGTWTTDAPRGAPLQYISSRGAGDGQVEYGSFPGIPVAEIDDTDSPYTVVYGDFLPINVTSGTVEIDVPANPNPGDWFSIVDSRGNAGSNNITVDFTSQTQPLHGTVQNYIMNTSAKMATFRYVDATIGWVVQD